MTSAGSRLSSNRYDGARGLTWTPDGQRILFARFNNGRQQIWSMAPDGSEQRQIISEGMSSWPAVSPDGRTIVFVSIRNGETGLWRADIDGSGSRLVAEVSDASHVTVAPDGRTLYFASTFGGPMATYRSSVDGGAPQLVAPLFDRASLSPDGKLLAGVYRAGPQAAITLAVLGVDDAKPVSIFPDFAVGPVVGAIMWSVDGKDLLYTTAERFNIWRRPYRGGDPVKLTNFTDLTVVRFAPSPDGRWLALCRGATTRDAYLLTGF